MEDTVKLASRIFSVSQSTLRLVLQKMTAYTQPLHPAAGGVGRDGMAWGLAGGVRGDGWVEMGSD